MFACQGEFDFVCLLLNCVNYDRLIFLGLMISLSFLTKEGRIRRELEARNGYHSVLGGLRGFK